MTKISIRDVYKLNFGKVSTTNQINERKVLRSACRCAASWLRCAASAAGDVRGLVAVACADTGAASWLQLHAQIQVRRAGCSCMRRYRRGALFAVACTMLFKPCFLGWLSRFKLIRLRRISLATLRRDGWRGGCLDMYCLPPAGVLHTQNKVIKCAVGAIKGN